MKTIGLYFCIFLLPLTSTFAAVSNTEKMDRELLVHGYDVRLHSDKYSLFLGPENTLLNERSYKLMKKEGKKLVVISEGEVIAMEPSQDQEELYRNPDVQIHLGQSFDFQNKKKQIVVFKFKGEGLHANKAIAFENFH